tara:strand:- start:455 stop:724 length:270 start_codon:yes stop_codon:yes gene_type:complete
MKNKYKLLINNVIKETELLESLDWDEKELKELYSYLDIHFTGDSIISPKILLEEISKKFGEPCSKILKDMFLKISLTHGLFNNDPNVEH